MLKLPVDAYIDEIARALKQSDALVLHAPPGTGKTTRVPAFLAFDLGLKVVVLEPRRLAARAAAARVASERGLTHGKEVGHAFRFEANWTQDTQLLFATEGTFLRLLEKEAFKADVVILDEFHERHLESDLALALLSCRKEKIIVMSATLAGLDLESHFKRVGRTVTSVAVSSPLFALETRYLENNPSVLGRKLSLLVLDALESAFEFGGDVLAFLPGVSDIEETQKVIEESYDDVSVLPLHGRLSVNDQAKVFAPSKHKKIILSTNVAESSLTVPGVRVVIDSGLAKQDIKNPITGLSTLETIKIAKSNAIQRAGRAAREANGLVLRLYAEHDFNSRAKSVLPDIERQSLESAALSLFAMKADYQWFEAPKESFWRETINDLQMLGAIDENENLTAIGEQLHQLPLDPRWGRVVLEARECDAKTRNHLWSFLSFQLGENSKILRERIEKQLGKPGTKNEPVEKLLLTGFVSMLARFDGINLTTASGKIMKLNQKLVSELAGEEWGIVFNADSFGRINTFLTIDSDWLYELEPLPFIESKDVEWNGRLIVLDRLMIGSLVIEESRKPVTMSEVPEGLKDKAMSLISKAQEKALHGLKQDERYARLEFAHRERNSSDLSIHVSQFLSSGEALQPQEFFSFLEGMAYESLGESIDQLVPWQLAGLKVIYSDSEPPHILAFIQSFYGQKNTPIMPVNKRAITLKLQGPHKRPVQVTNDLAGFWQRGYKELLKEMRREYPRHHWPDNPESAPAVLLKRQLPS